jgi:hypothetical protein
MARRRRTDDHCARRPLHADLRPAARRARRGSRHRQLLRRSDQSPAPPGPHLLTLCFAARLPARRWLYAHCDRLAQPGYRDHRRPAPLPACTRAAARHRRRDSSFARHRRLAAARFVRGAFSASVRMDGLERSRLHGCRAECRGARRNRMGEHLPLGRLCRTFHLDATWRRSAFSHRRGRARWQGGGATRRRSVGILPWRWRAHALLQQRRGRAGGRDRPADRGLKRRRADGDAGVEAFAQRGKSCASA